MIDLGAAAAGVKILSGLKGLFGGGRQKTVSSGENLVSLAGGAREAAEKYGFNPLTLLKAGSGMSGFSTGTPPLASAEILTGGLQGLDDILSGDEERRRAADQLNLDLAKLKLEQARSGVAVAPVSATQAVAPSPLGNRPLQVYPSSGSTFARSGGFNAQGPVSSADQNSKGASGPVDMAGNPSTRVVVAGQVIEPNPAFSDAEYIEQRYGELASWTYGTTTAVADAQSIGWLADDSSADPKRWSKHKKLEEFGAMPDGYLGGKPYWVRADNGVKTFILPKDQPKEWRP